MDLKSAEIFIGAMYGNILHRNADEEGWKHYINLLDSDSISPLDVLREFLTCEEFVEKWVVNDTPNGLTARIMKFLYGDYSLSPSMIKNYASIFVYDGLLSLVTLLANDKRMQLDKGGVPMLDGRNF